MLLNERDKGYIYDIINYSQETLEIISDEGLFNDLKKG